jgi:hypothetical protein
MTLDETRALLGYAAGIDPRVRRNDPDERALQAAAWHAALAGLPVADAKAGIDRHYAQTREAALPADVRRHAMAIRAARIDAAGHLEPPAGLTDAEQIQWLRTARQAVADGAPPPPRIEGARAMPAPPDGMFALPPQIRAGLGRSDERLAALRRACPHCRAQPRQPCVNPGTGQRLASGAHPARAGDTPSPQARPPGQAASAGMRLPDDPDELALPPANHDEAAP